MIALAYPTQHVAWFAEKRLKGEPVPTKLGTGFRLYFKDVVGWSEEGQHIVALVLDDAGELARASHDSDHFLGVLEVSSAQGSRIAVEAIFHDKIVRLIPGAKPNKREPA